MLPATRRTTGSFLIFHWETWRQLIRTSGAWCSSRGWPGISHSAESPILGISFVNSGNRPIILSKILVSFGYDSEFNAASNCKRNGENRWTGIPWDQNFDGDKVTKSVPRSIFPQVATPTIYTFGNWPVVPGEMGKMPERSLKACLIYEAINSKGKIVKTKPFPLGVVTFTDTRITNFEIDKNAKSPVTIFD